MIKGVDKSNALKIMEAVRKNKELKQEELDIMKEHGVPDWYVESCRTPNTYSLEPMLQHM